MGDKGEGGRFWVEEGEEGSKMVDLSGCPQMPQKDACGGTVAPQLGQLCGGEVIMSVVPWNAFVFYFIISDWRWYMDSDFYIIMIAERLRGCYVMGHSVRGWCEDCIISQ